MTKPTIAVPALTPELRFSLEHWQEMDQLVEDKTGRYKDVISAIENINKRASVDAKERIIKIMRSITSELQGKTAKIDWSPRIYDWGNWGHLRKPGGKSRIAWIAVDFDAGNGTPRVVLSVTPRGGKSGCRFIRERLREQWKPLLTPQDNLELWPGWEADGPCLVYHIYTLNLKSTLSDVATAVSRGAREFFTVAMPCLHQLRTG